jgi:hypothetical protein
MNESPCRPRSSISCRGREIRGQLSAKGAKCDDDFSRDSPPRSESGMHSTRVMSGKKTVAATEVFLDDPLHGLPCSC